VLIAACPYFERLFRFDGKVINICDSPFPQSTNTTCRK
jgi:hypothetical protein